MANKSSPEEESMIDKENSLAYRFPELAKEWHPTKNGSLRPESIAAHSGKRVWWKCNSCGYEWMTDICSRTNGTGCPECKKDKIRLVQSEPIYCPELGQLFKSGHDAKRQTGISQSSISNCCNGILKSAGKHPLTGEKLTWIKI